MENNPNYYAIIPAEVRYDKNLKDKAKLLYGEITALCNDKGYCYANNKYFASLYKVSIRTITDLIKSLIDNGYLKSELVYKDNSKEVVQRRLYLWKKSSIPLEEIFYTPLEENFQDNNTYINNTNNKYIYSRVIDYLNQKTGTNYKSTTKSTKEHINARLKDGFKEEDFIKVIDIKYNDWKNTKFEKFLRPDTLFGTKFESYLNQKQKENWWDE